MASKHGRMEGSYEWQAACSCNDKEASIDRVRPHVFFGATIRHRPFVTPYQAANEVGNDKNGKAPLSRMSAFPLVGSGDTWM